MRNLDECKAEILRLGEKKIKERKKRRMRVLSVCIPLCLCLVVWSVVMLPAMLPANAPAPPEADTGKLPGDIWFNESTVDIVMIYTQVDIKGLGNISFYQQIKEPLKTNYMAGLIDGFYNEINDGGSAGSTDDPPYLNDSPDNKDVINPSQQSGYLISFTKENGFKVEYTLRGAILTNNSNGKSILLSTEQKNQLLLEITGGV